MKLLALLCLFAVKVPAFGYLGGTVAECDARYGKPLAPQQPDAKPAYPLRVYQVGKRRIYIRFLEGRASNITIISQDGLHPEEVTSILGTNRENSEWQLDTAATAATQGSPAEGPREYVDDRNRRVVVRVARDDVDRRIYRRVDKKATARFQQLRGQRSATLTLHTDEWMDRMMADVLKSARK